MVAQRINGAAAFNGGVFGDLPTYVGPVIAADQAAIGHGRNGTLVADPRIAPGNGAADGVVHRADAAGDGILDTGAAAINAAAIG